MGLIEGDLESRGLWSSTYESSRRGWLHRAIELVKPRVKKVSDFVAQLEPFLRERVDYDPAAVDKHLRTAGLADHIAALGEAFRALDAFDVATIEAALRRVADGQRCEGRCPHSCDARGTDGPGGQPGTLRGGGAGRTGGHRGAAARARAFPARPRGLTRPKTFFVPSPKLLTGGRFRLRPRTFATAGIHRTARLLAAKPSLFQHLRHSRGISVAAVLIGTGSGRSTELNDTYPVEVYGGQRRSRIRIDGPRETAGDCQ